MRTKRTAAVLACLALCFAAVTLSGCSSDSDASATDTSIPPSVASSQASAFQSAAQQDANEVLYDVNWQSQGEGKAPRLVFTPPFTTLVSATRLIKEGTGETITAGARITVNYVAVNGSNGSVIESTWAEGSTTDMTLNTDSVDQTLIDGLVGHKVGCQILYSVAPGSATSTDSTTSSVLGIEVEGTHSIPSAAAGATLTPDLSGLPSVSFPDPSSGPSLAPASGNAPTDLVVKPLIKGTGAAVKQGDSITVNYAGWLWNGTEFDSSYGSSPFTTTLDTSSLISGWVTGLAGQAVGSRVLLVIPPAYGYGGQAMGEIPANSTLVFMIDILDDSGQAVSASPSAS
ncbi:MAG: FKBP-type peptidyl-prolyl cis-trans isomerase [Bifidobacteriaceae bacterium]|jgi:peptidylprolyl isomerase|nr:FKBP-type peptidyl-prolyl cis-trans isomerase [Bifidobacteriaceae bacterium]